MFIRLRFNDFLFCSLLINLFLFWLIEIICFQSYCEKHSKTSKKDCSEGESDVDEGGAVAPTPALPTKKKRDLTSEQKSQARPAKLRQIEAEFYNHVDVLQTSKYLDIDLETTETIFNFWKLKRRVSMIRNYLYYQVSSFGWMGCKKLRTM